jgi:hypothetical protein
LTQKLFLKTRKEDEIVTTFADVAGGLPKSGRHFRLYMAGIPIGGGTAGDPSTWVDGRQAMSASRGQASLKYTRTENREDVFELGNPDVFGVAQFNSKHSITLDHTFISFSQMKKELGLDTTGPEIPDIPLFFDVVEKNILPGTEQSITESATSYRLYERCSITGSDLSRAAQAVSTVSLTADCKERPRDFNGVPIFELATGDGIIKTFTLAVPALGPLADDNWMIRVESPADPLGPNSVILHEGPSVAVPRDFYVTAVATTLGTSTLTVNFTEAPGDGDRILFVYLADRALYPIF